MVQIYFANQQISFGKKDIVPYAQVTESLKNLILIKEYSLKFILLFAALQCPPNSNYSFCASRCPKTCTSGDTTRCDQSCVEGCVCNEGFVLSGDQCVSLADCGCKYRGQYYLVCCFCDIIVVYCLM